MLNRAAEKRDFYYLGFFLLKGANDVNVIIIRRNCRDVILGSISSGQDFDAAVGRRVFEPDDIFTIRVSDKFSVRRNYRARYVPFIRMPFEFEIFKWRGVISEIKKS